MCLMGQSFLPFPTAMVGEYSGNALVVSFFGCVFALNALPFMALQAHPVGRLIKPELAALQDPHGLRKAFVGRCISSARPQPGLDPGCLRHLCADAVVVHHAVPAARERA
jgi:hypothetical protein